MRESWDGESKGSAATFVAAYGLWALTMVVAFGVCVTWHGALMRLYLTLGLNKWGASAFTYAVVILLLMSWLVLVIVAESWYRRAAENGTLLRRGALVLGILIALTALGMAVNQVG